jgi:voltage-gated potassium channel
MDRLRRIVEESDTLAGKSFDLTIQFLIICSLISFSIGTIPDLSETTIAILDLFEIVTVIIFTLEYLLRVFVARIKTHFIFSFFGIIDILSILPFYLAIGMDLRSLRAFRILRLVKILKLARYSSALRRFRLALTKAKEELILFSMLTLITLYMAGVGIYYFENSAQPEYFQSIFHSLWWAVTTLTTVGYGDMYPITMGGKIFTFIVLFIGLGVVAIPAGIVASALSEAREELSGEE